MTTLELFENTSKESRADLLDTLIRKMLTSNDERDVELDQEVDGGDLTEAFCNGVHALKQEAETNLAMINNPKLYSQENPELETIIEEEFENQSDKLLSEGEEAQIRYLVVEVGYTHKRILEALGLD